MSLGDFDFAPKLSVYINLRITYPKITDSIDGDSGFCLWVVADIKNPN